MHSMLITNTVVNVDLSFSVHKAWLTKARSYSRKDKKPSALFPQDSSKDESSVKKTEQSSGYSAFWWLLLLEQSLWANLKKKN